MYVYRYIYTYKHERFNLGYILALLALGREFLKSEKLVIIRVFSDSHSVSSWPLRLRLLFLSTVGSDSPDSSSWCLST